MGFRSQKSGDEWRSWESGNKSESAASWKSGNELELVAYGRARESYLIGAVEYVLPGVVSVGCDGVGGIVKGGDDKMREEGQHRRRAAAT